MLAATQTLIDLLRRRAQQQPDQLAHTFIGDAGEITLTYAELDHQARRIAARLQSLNAEGERVLLLYPPGLEFIAAFFGCLYAGAVAVPVYPPRRNRNLLRLLAIVKDSEASIAMTTDTILARMKPWFADTPQVHDLRWLASDTLAQSEPDWRQLNVAQDSLAFLQYTSGSTGKPKGVMLTHENLIFNAALVYTAVDHAPGDKYVSWLPTFHDMGFMAGVLQPLYGGFESVLMSPASFLQRPVSWLEAITRYRATTSGAPNFAYELCVRKTNAEQRATLDLSSWTVAFNGAEPIRVETLERFVAAFEPCGFRREAFYPCYGLAEATLMVAGSVKTSAPVSKRVSAKALLDHRVVDSNDRVLVGCGRNLGSQKICIVNPDTSVECKSGEVGEIWVAGPSVAQGYWRKPELTEETFGARVAGTGAGPFLRTGDLGFLDAGELYVTGRLKDLVIIRGFNHYPQDIELTVERCDRALRPGCGAAFAVEAAGEERLVIVYEVDQRVEVDLNALRERIVSAIAEEHELQTYAIVFIAQGSVPKTSSGKIQRHACQAGFLNQTLEVIAEWRQDLNTEDATSESLEDIGDLETWLGQQIAHTLRISLAEVDAHKPLAHYGLDSLGALELIYSVETATGVSLSLASFLQQLSIADLAAEIRAIGPTLIDATASDPRSDQPLSRGQQALWFLHRLASESAAYNLAGAVRIVGEVDVDALRSSFQALVDRHPSLRTTYHEANGLPVQRVHELAAVSFHEEVATSWSPAELDLRLEKEAQAAFDLETGPPLRVTLFTRGANERVLLLVVHHIVTDFWSLAVLIHELGLLYRGQTLAPLPLQYADYVLREEQMLSSAEGDRLWSYWQKQLAGELPVTDLPTDRPRPAVQTFAGASHAFKIDPALTTKLKAIAREHGATLYMLLLASFQMLLHRYTGQEDILVGSPAAGRTRADLAGLVGYFVNPLVLRADFSGNPTVAEFLDDVRGTVLDAYRHQEYPFALLVEKLQPVRDPARSPLFQVMFTFHQSHLRDENLAQFALGEGGARMNVGGLELESTALDQRVAQFDVTLMMAEAGDGLVASLQYNRDLFDRETIERMAQHFETLLSAVVNADETKRVRELAWLTENERTQIIYDWNDTETVVDSSLSIAKEIAARAAELGDAVALVCGTEELTYAQLNARANQLGHYLQRLGVGPETVVGVRLERSIDLVVALLGVLKSGGAYLPLDPSYPQERLSWMLSDARVRVVLSDLQQIASEGTEDLHPNVTDENLAYVIYTSGSTGRPKGVMVQQGNVKNFFRGMDQSLSNGSAEGKQETWLAVTSVSFDISVLELLWSLRRGSRVVLQSELARKSGSAEGEEAEVHAPDFSLFYFAATSGANGNGDHYRLLLEGARYADAHGYKAVWTPERHFHEFGGLYPNPSVTSAALATITEHVQLRAGSVVLPLHNPLRVAEEWSVIDNLSGGRVGVSFASGWHADDFVLAPNNYERRQQLMEEGIELVRRLWRGEAARVRGGSGNEVDVRIQPRPVQLELPVWVTAAGAVETFRQAGRLGASVLTHLLGQSVEDLDAKVQAYRAAWREAGHDGRGHVTLMLHTFVGADEAEVKRQVHAPMLQYLSSSLGLIERLAKSLGKDLGQLSGADYDEVLEYAFERYYEKSGLLGTVDKCVSMVQRLRRIGIDEVACLIDFGPGVDEVLESLRFLDEVRRRSEAEAMAARKRFERSIPIGEQLRRQSVTHLQCTPTLAGALLQDAEAREGLKRLEQLLVGGEALPGSLAGALRQTVKGSVHNMYGPTETTIWSTTHVVDATDAETPIVSIGRPIANTHIYLLDDQLQPVPVGVRGEVYIGGEGVARGYWNRGELTAERFVPDPFSRRGGQRLYRTGDEARYLANGEIEYLGRSDQQVKLRGYRIELGEIEAALREYEGVTNAAVAVRGERLVAYVVGEMMAGDGLRQFLQERLPEYMVPSFYMNLAALPQTPNGKLDRKALPEPEAGAVSEYEGPRTPVEEVLAAIIAEVLGVARVGRHDNFFALGGHSLLAMQVISRIRETFQVELPVRVLFESPTLAGIGRHLEQGAARVEAPPLRRVDRNQLLPLSFAQQRLWFLDRFEADRHIYNVPVRVELRGSLDYERLCQSLNRLLMRHDVLRTSFREVGGHPVQEISERVAIELAADLQDEERIAAEEVCTPFELERAPLLRARLVRRDEDDHLLLLTLHHAICDGWSLGILLKELVAFYAGNELAELPVQYADYAVWQREWLQGAVLEAQLSYWRERLQGAPTALELPTDYPRPALHRYRAATLQYQLNAELSNEMQALSQREGVTLLMLLLASLQVLLSRYANSQDISVGVPIAGRNRVETEGLVGLFLNTLVLRTEWSDDPTFRELLAKVREVALGAYAHQELPFEKLVEELQPERDLSRTPLFQVMLVLQNAPLELPPLTDLEIGAFEVATRSTNYDLTFSINESDTGLEILLDYNAFLFKEERMQRLLRHWERLLQSTVSAPNSKLTHLQWLTDDERKQLVYGWNETHQPYDTTTTVVDLIAQQAAQHPDAIAIISGEEQLTYAELNERANQLAQHLREQGVGPETIVGVCMERTAALPVALLGVLKSGGAYLPLDPSYPRERVAWILEDAGVEILLTEAVGTRIKTDRENRIWGVQLAYLIYTSGSTGRPKGVQVTHANLVNFLLSMQAQPGLTAEDTLLAVTTLAFDIAGLEIYLPLITGGRLVLASRAATTDGRELLKLLRESGATVMQATPATWRLLLDALVDANERLQLKVLCGGEALPGSLVAALRERIDGPIYNLYGPTETTIWSALHTVEAGDAETPIVSLGRPIANTQLYLLDEAMQPVPVGVRGELYIGGAGVARGYWRRGELTAARFVPDPFSHRGGQRLYRTADEARYLENGEIEYLGRSDQQVKLRGYRIELGEIEAALREHESVSNAAVAVKGERLVAYVVGEVIDSDALRQHLQQRLPDYMVPSTYVPLVALPQTPNGKLDRKALPEPEAASEAEYEAPRTPVEEVLAAIVADVLKVPRVSRQDNFFALGGHSLLASQLLFRLQKAFQLDLSLLSIFQSPKLADLAAHISRLKTIDEQPPIPEFPKIIPDPLQRHEPFPLTDVQQAYWIGRTGIFELGNIATHIAVEVESTGLDLARLNLALQRLITRHEMLRAIILPDGRQQILDSVPPYQIEILDLRDLAPDAKSAKLEEVRASMSHQVLRADQWPLFEIRASRIDDQTTRIHLSFDLLIGDARSFQIISQELRELYAEPDQPAKEFDLSFRDYVLAEAQLNDSALYQRSQQYWLNRLPTLPPAPDLPLAKNPNTINQPRFVRRYGELPTALWQQLKQRAARAGVTPSGVLLAAFSEVLATWSKSPKFTINLTLFNRLPLHEQVNDIVGDFTSLTLLAVDNSATTDFETRARSIQAQLWSDMDHRYMSGVRVLREVARAHGGKAGATMPVVFTSMLSLQDPKNSAGWSLNWLGEQVYGISQTPQVWLDHQTYEDAGRLGFNWDAVEELFPAELLDDMFAAYVKLLHSLAESDEQWHVTSRELIPNKQLQQRAAINATAAPISDELLHTLIAAQVAQRSDHPALIHADRVLTYAELFAQSNQLAHRLRRLGARPNKLVAVVMEKGWEQTVAVLGILQAGAAYLPIEATLPSERINYLLAQGEAEIVVTQSWIDQKLPWRRDVQRVCIGSADLSAESTVPLPSIQKPEDLAYVIFTSGSTGQPKGVMIDHRGAVNTVLDINRRFRVGPNDRVLALSSLSFDLSVYDIFGLLAAGGTIVVPEAASRRDPKHWADMVARHRVTIWNSVPALMNIQVDHLSERGRESLESLRLVMMSGDWIPVSLPDRIRQLIDDVEVISLGGATEASIWSILYPIAAVDPSWKSIPYGRPMWNQSWQILNERLEPCPVWTVGELYIGGIGLAKGYWRDEQKTNRSFITHPRTSERLYRTGDLGRYLPDGNIEFLGREDSQVKIQGYRIELGEIEAALEEHEDVRAAVVNALGEQRGSKRLIGYVVPEQTAPTTAQLQQHLKTKLPEYMIPQTFMFLDKLPLSSNGKVDRRALPEPERTQPDEATLVAPGNWKEQALAEIWSRVLGIEQVGINDNFFELGGDSILSIRAAAQASEAGLPLTPDQIFQYRTIAELSAVVGTTEVVEAEQGIVTGEVPLTPIQHWFFEQEFADPHHWNQALLLEVRQSLDPSLMKQAVGLLLDHHDALRLRFTRDDNGWRQTNAAPDASVPFEWLDLSTLAEAQQTVAVETVAAETQASLDLAHGPLLRVVIFDLGACKPGRLLIAIHHLVVDGVSWRILLDDLERVYNALRRGETPSLPAKTTSYLQWSEKLQAEVDAGAFASELEYWTHVVDQPVPPLPLDHADGTARNTAGSAQTVTMKLSERETRALLYEIAEAYHTQINEVLLAALAEAFRRWTGERRVLVDVEGHGREAIVPAIDLARTVGWFTAIYPVQLESPLVWGPGAALKETKEHLRAVPRWGLGYGILNYLAHAESLRTKAAPVSFNYLGQLDQAISGSALYRAAPESVGPAYSPLSRRTHLLAFYGSVFGGQFQLAIEYSRHVHDETTIDKLADHFMTALRAIIAHCTSGESFSYTPSDFPLINVDQEQLDKAFSLIEFEE